MTSMQQVSGKVNWVDRVRREVNSPGTRAFLVGAVLISGFALLFPGDVSFVNDEPLIIREALLHNQQGKIVTEGLRGNLGIKYGPVPFWFYQLMLLLTHNLILISLVKNLLHLAIFTYALLYLGKELNLTRPFALLVLCSPYIMHLNRVLWSFALMGPLSGCLVLWLLRFRRTGKYRYFLLSVLTTIAFTYTHPMSAFITIPFYISVFVFCYKFLLARKLVYATTLAVALATVSPFLLSILYSLQQGGAAAPKSNLFFASLTSIVGSLYFSSVGWAGFYLPQLYQTSFLLPSGILLPMIYATGVSCILYLVGVGRSVWLFIGHFRRRTFTSRDVLTFFALLSILSNTAFLLVTRVIFYPHYFLPLWLPFFFFIWVALHWCWKSRPRLIAVLVPIWLCHCIILVVTTLFIHQNGGSREDQYGATLANQMQVADIVKGESKDSVIITTVSNYQKYPHALDLLIDLSRVTPQPNAKPKVVQIIYADPESASGWIVVRRKSKP